MECPFISFTFLLTEFLVKHFQFCCIFTIKPSYFRMLKSDSLFLILKITSSANVSKRTHFQIFVLPIWASLSIFG